MKIDEQELESMHARERRFERDDEHERFDWARMRPTWKPRYSRFRTLARIAEAQAAAADAAEVLPLPLKEAA